MAQTIGIVGGGIVGLAIAYKLQLKHPGTKVMLFEKELQVGLHQSGRNSGVLHCGLYYTPGSLKARLATSGIQQMTSFCKDHEIPHEICGKVVVATNEREAVFLDNLAERGKQNGLKGLAFLSKKQLAEREPYVVAYKSLLVPEEGIVDYKAVMETLSNLIKNKGGEIILNTEILNTEESGDKIIVKSVDKNWNTDFLINCTGLFSDRTYKKFTSLKRPLRIVPFRGEYMMLKPEAEYLVNHLVYPVPDPEYPFLGIHFTRMMNGKKEVGPNAVFAFKREGYVNTDFSLTDTLDSVSYKGFLNFVRKNFIFSVGELGSSLFKGLFIKKAQKMIPDIKTSHLVKGTAGVRAQAMDVHGKLIMDFNVEKIGRQIHVLNAPSPGATASLAIADYIIDQFLNKQ